jgi:hypothetical protein
MARVIAGGGVKVDADYQSVFSVLLHCTLLPTLYTEMNFICSFLRLLNID